MYSIAMFKYETNLNLCMDLDKCLERKQCKAYKKKDVSRGIIAEILLAATKAYSPGGLENWVFIVVDDSAIKDELANVSKKQHWMRQAPIFIVICHDVSRVTDFFPARGEIYSVSSGSSAAEIITLKAASLGLGSAWVSSFDEKAVSRLLQLPGNVRPHAIITIGYPEAIIKDKSKPIDITKITFFNSYGSSVNVAENFNLTQ